MTPTYASDFIANPDELFAHLMCLPWLEVTEARKEYFMSDEPRSYVYGKGIGQRLYHSQPYTPEVSAVQDILNDNGNGYNLCFLNRYDHQKQQLGWHADDSPEMNHAHPIAVVSLGEPREIWWKRKGEQGVVPASNRKLLEHGSLFVMPAGFQRDHLHRIPKHDRDCGIRISLTFRQYVSPATPPEDQSREP